MGLDRRYGLSHECEFGRARRGSRPDETKEAQGSTLKDSNAI
jgi:hypothetical protein